MLAEGMKALYDLSVAAATPKLLREFPTEAIFSVGGEQQTVEIPVTPRDHKAGTLTDLIALANRFAESGEDKPVAWYDEDEVILVIDDDGHRFEKATLGLEWSDLFSIVVALRREPRLAWKEPKDFVRLIRVDLAGAFPDDLLLNAVRRLKFEGGNVTTAENARGRESLGREITAKVEQVVPEVVVLMIPVYKTPGMTGKFPLRCTVEVDPMMCKIQLLPFPDEIEKVLQLAVDLTSDALADGLKDVPHYQGKP